MKGRKQTWIAPRLVAVDFTEYWHSDITDKAGKIATVYLFDANRVTHCCEMTPSYEMVPLYYRTEREITDPLRQEIDDQMVHEQFYQYFHTYQIEGMECAALPKQRVLKDVGYEDTFESLREHYQGNWLL